MYYKYIEEGIQIKNNIIKVICIITLAIAAIAIYYLNRDKEFDYLKILKNYDLDEYTGKGVRIAVIDSGLEEDSGLVNADHLLNFTNSKTVYDENGHGTKMINIICNKQIGIAPESDLYSLKVLNQNCEGNYLDTIKAIEWCINNNIQIINLSIASIADSSNMKNVIEKANKNGIIIISSLSNLYSQKNYPADYRDVIGVYTKYEMYKENKYRIFCPYYKFYTINQVEGCMGNSPATAYCSGICSRLIEKYLNDSIVYNREIILSDIKKILREN